MNDTSAQLTQSDDEEPIREREMEQYNDDRGRVYKFFVYRNHHSRMAYVDAKSAHDWADDGTVSADDDTANDSNVGTTIIDDDIIGYINVSVNCRIASTCVEKETEKWYGEL